MIASEFITTPPVIAARGLHHLLCATGGFTLDHGTGEPLHRGVAVCADPDQAWCFPLDDWDDDRVAQWVLEQHRRLDEGDVHLGGWLQGSLGTVWLELVWVLPNRLQPAALALARMHGQHAVFDLARRQLVRIDEPVANRGAR